MRRLPEWGKPPITGAVVNGELRELTYPIDMDARVHPVDMSDADGARIYRRSLVFLLQAAFEDTFPQAGLVVDHSVVSGGYFCHVIDHPPLSDEQVTQLEGRMKEIVEKNMPIERQITPIQEALAFFERKRQYDKLQLMKYRNKDHFVLYQLDDHRDYHHGYMVPSTGFLKWFCLMPLGEGFILQYPRRHNPTEILPILGASNLLETFHQYGNWLNKLGIESVGSLNDSIQAGRIREIILVSEALHEQKIAEIASQIAERQGKVQIVLAAGPSSSGKTTFSKRLAVQLLAQGIAPMAVELDNYFVDREETPLDENGQYDYEALGALNTRRLGEDMRRLIEGEEVQLPHYNFLTGQSEPGEVVRLEKDQIIILEGIHGLNPGLLPAVPNDLTMRIYISCLTQLNLDHYNRISTTDTRLIRRIVRDSHERGYSALQTIQRWESVRRGEKRYIFSHQDNANEIFNSALAYELSALKPLAMPLLRQVPFGTPEYIEAKRLLAFLEWFLPIDADLIPDNSILREFLGNSILKDFKLWKRSPKPKIDTQLT
ncbi:MAG: nucleoside kinase [Anaerolineaceae bacterium]|nr:nucleoside kinase [Anaerolineaceae bacterium]